MDDRRFDALTRVLGAVIDRRGGARTALGAAFGLAVGESALARGRGKGAPGAAEGGVQPQGPCQTTKRPDNICQKNGDCCTNICDTGKGQKNKDKKGRCRCIRWKRPCSEDRNCCSRKNQKMACLEGICQKVIPTNHACKAGEICESKKASCTHYDDFSPSGTYCLIPVTGECTIPADCTTYDCVKRRCLVSTGATCGPVQDDTLCADYGDGAQCTTYDDGQPAGNYCLMPLQGVCTKDSQCMNERCVDGKCQNPAQLTEPCGNSNAGAICVTPGALCTTYTYSGAPSGTYCLLPDNINKDVPTRCAANDQCRSGQCAKVGEEGQCAPLTCSVCQPYDGVSACPYDSLQGYVDDNGSGGQITVFEGKHLGQVNLTDKDWHILPCCEDCFPEIGPADGDSYGIVLDVNEFLEKHIIVERMTLGGELPVSWWLQAWGYFENGTDIAYMNVLLDRIKTNLKAGNTTYLNGSEETKYEIRDSVTKGLFIKSGVDQALAPSCYVTLTRSTLEGWGNTALQDAIGIDAKTTHVSLVNSTVKNFSNSTTDDGAGITMRSPDSTAKSSLTMDASSKITGNVGAGGQGYGIYAPNGETVTGATPSNVFQNGGTTGVLQCSTGSSTACTGF